MILASLCALAERERLVEEPAFTSVGVRWVIDVTKDGRFLSLTDTNFIPASSGKRKPKPQPKRMSIPRRSGRTSGAKAEFLVDKSEYVLGALPNEEQDSKRSEHLRSLFIAEMQRAQTNLHSPEIDAALTFLTNSEQLQICVTELNQHKYASNDLFTFRVQGRFLPDVDAVRMYCSKHSSDVQEPSKPSSQCLVCGKECQPATKHEPIQLAGGGSQGVPLVSFNKAAFYKHGLMGSDNAPVCRSCMIAYTTALRRLLKGYPNPQGGNFERQSVLLNEDTTAVFWAEEPSLVSETLPMLNEDPSIVEKMIASPWKGQASAAPETPFYCLLLTGSRGRVILRGMHTSTLGAVTDNLKLYFDCLHASGYDLEPAPIHILLRSLSVRGKLDTLPPGLAAEVFLSAVLGRTFSRRFLSAAVGRNRAERKVTRPRAALLHLYFKLLLKESFLMALDAQSLDPAYRYGRLLAVLEGLQHRAHGRKMNSTIVDRFYGAASTRPAIVFPRLLQLAQTHLRKIPTQSGFFKRRIEEVMDGLDGAAGFRPMLKIEEQGRFALGYFHQRAAQFNKRDDVASGNVDTQENTEGSEE